MSEAEAELVDRRRPVKGRYQCAIKDKTGKTYGQWTVLRRHGFYRPTKWLCRCSCGTERPVLASSLGNGKSASCGCISKAKTIERSFKHGQAKRKGSSGAYNTWSRMLQRCCCLTNPRYPDYGGRGIRICDRWLEFANFFEDMGPRPKGMSIERIDVNGNYEPDNCIWLPWNEQSINRRTTHWLTFKGETLTASDWGKRMFANSTLVLNRIRLGWNTERAITTPYHPRGPNKSPQSAPIHQESLSLA